MFAENTSVFSRWTNKIHLFLVPLQIFFFCNISLWLVGAELRDTLRFNQGLFDHFFAIKYGDLFSV